MKRVLTVAPLTEAMRPVVDVTRQVDMIIVSTIASLELTFFGMIECSNISCG